MPSSELSNSVKTNEMVLEEIADHLENDFGIFSAHIITGPQNAAFIGKKQIFEEYSNVMMM